MDILLFWAHSKASWASRTGSEGEGLFLINKECSNYQEVHEREAHLDEFHADGFHHGVLFHLWASVWIPCELWGQFL